MPSRILRANANSHVPRTAKTTGLIWSIRYKTISCGLTFALSRAAQRHLTTDRKPRRLQRKLDAGYSFVSVFRMQTQAIGRPDMRSVSPRPISSNPFAL